MYRYLVILRESRLKRAVSSSAARTVSQWVFVSQSEERALVGAHVKLSKGRQHGMHI